MKSALLVIRGLGDQSIIFVGFINRAGVIGISFLLPLIDCLNALIIRINATLLNNGRRRFGAAIVWRPGAVSDSACRAGSSSEHDCRSK
jgi:hypothetical protein